MSLIVISGSFYYIRTYVRRTDGHNDKVIYSVITMCTRQQCFDRITEAAPNIKDRFGVKSLCVFGSMARGDNKPDSDVDVCVEMPPKAFTVLALKSYLQDLLGVSVDLVRRHAHMDKFLTKEIERDGIYLIS